MASQYVLTSIATAGGKALKVVDTANKLVYTYPLGTGMVAEQPTSTIATSYDIVLTHPMVGRLVMPVASITTISGVAPAGNNYITDSDSITALLP